MAANDSEDGKIQWMKGRNSTYYAKYKHRAVGMVAELYPGEWSYSTQGDPYFHSLPNAHTLEEAQATAIAIWRMS